MLDGTYEVGFDTPLGRKTGTVEIHTNGTAVTADIKAPVVGKQHLEGTADGDTFSGKGSIKIMLMGKVDFSLHGNVEGDTLNVTIETDKGNLHLTGARIA